MVKNTTGGTGTKSLGRKHQTSRDTRLVLSVDEYEKYAIVTKMFGNGMCEIKLNDDTTLIGHIRKKFSGRNKRHNFISAFTIVLVNLRDYEKPPKNCDIISIYDEIQIEQLKQIPGINIESLINMRIDGSNCKTTDLNLTFSLEEEEEPTNKLTINDHFAIQKSEEIDIDDI